MLHTLWEWLPTVPEFVAGLTYVDREPFTYHMVTDGWVTEADWALWKHRQVGGSGFFQHPSNIRMNLFAELSEWTGDHWNVPFAVLAGYLAMIVVGPRLMANREALPVHLLVCAWNWGLALFSLCGMVTTWSAIIDLIASKGYEATVCGHPAFMAQSYVGVAMALFIYSKLAELIDTWFLVAKKSNVIFLHWYHHVTVLLYCWHSYSTRITSGIWFAAMNYFVHAIMYAYFAMTQMGPRSRRMVRPYAQLITTLQISQMFVGLLVNGSIIFYTSQGHRCKTNKTNTILSWLMYLSYFVLFGLLYLRNYIMGAAKPAGKRAKAE